MGFVGEPMRRSRSISTLFLIAATLTGASVGCVPNQGTTADNSSNRAPAHVAGGLDPAADEEIGNTSPVVPSTDPERTRRAR